MGCLVRSAAESEARSRWSCSALQVVRYNAGRSPNSQP